jgi:hypothetical protein
MFELGAIAYGGGEEVNVALFSRYARRVRLELFDHAEDSATARVN